MALRLCEIQALGGSGSSSTELIEQVEISLAGGGKCRWYG